MRIAIHMNENLYPTLGLSLATTMTALHLLNIQTTMVHYSAADKGQRIHIIDGNYSGRDGWRWAGKKDTRKYTWVIIKLEDDQEKGTRVLTEFVGDPLGPPVNYVDAALQQHNEIDRTFNKLCRMLAKCHLTGDDQDLLDTFKHKMQTAQMRQNSQGQSANWFYVEFDDQAE